MLVIKNFEVLSMVQLPYDVSMLYSTYFFTIVFTFQIHKATEKEEDLLKIKYLLVKEGICNHVLNIYHFSQEHASQILLTKMQLQETSSPYCQSQAGNSYTTLPMLPHQCYNGPTNTYHKLQYRRFLNTKGKSSSFSQIVYHIIIFNIV